MVLYAEETIMKPRTIGAYVKQLRKFIKLFLVFIWQKYEGGKSIIKMILNNYIT